eukprot:m.94569 g.94569  ORF g.94569 m.94569 type:complete len:69 (+) comp14730_c1_seq1:72-278(+)
MEIQKKSDACCFNQRHGAKEFPRHVVVVVVVCCGSSEVVVVVVVSAHLGIVFLFLLFMSLCFSSFEYE